MIKPAFIDMSHWNEVIGSSYSAAASSLQRCMDSGILGMVHKATESDSYKDDHLIARCDLCRDVGMAFGTYHFLRTTDIGEQVGFYVDTVLSIQKKNDEALRWLWVCDYEDPGVSLAAVGDFMEQLEIVCGRLPWLYTGFALKDKIAAGQDASRLTRWPLWLAQYATEPVLPKGWSEWAGWQYSDKASVPGIVSPTDVNAYEGNVEEFFDDWYGEPPLSGPEPCPPGTVTVTVPKGTKVVVREEEGK